MRLIGKLCVFYDPYHGKKTRPVLVIGKSDATEYTALPISRVTSSQYINTEYDIKIVPADYPATNLTDISYIRTHKQITLHRSQFAYEMSDLKTLYPDKYLEVVVKLEQFNKTLIDNAL